MLKIYGEMVGIGTQPRMGFHNQGGRGVGMIGSQTYDPTLQLVIFPGSMRFTPGSERRGLMPTAPCLNHHEDGSGFADRDSSQMDVNRISSL